MAMPPMKSNGVSYFDLLLQDAKDILEENHVRIDISGYNETIYSLYHLEMLQDERAWELSQELNAWSDYFSDINSNCKKILKNLEAEKMAIVAEASINADSTKVSNGDRLANKNSEVVSIRKKRNTMESLCDLLDAKIEYLERAHYMCKKTFELAQNIKDINNDKSL